MRIEVERLGSDRMTFATLQRVLETPNTDYHLVSVLVLGQDVVAVWNVEQ